jgi:predicted P-loop ATPase
MGRADVIAQDEQARAKEIDRVRRMLAHPRGAIEVDGNTVRFLKPPYPRVTNVEVVLTQDSMLRQAPRLNLFSGLVEWNGEPLTDEHITICRLQLERTYELKASPSDLHAIIKVIAAQVAYHPVVDWLESLRWDGVPRAGELFTRYAGASSAPILEVFGRKFLISAVARVMQPGCQVDTMPVLQGAQGLGKSSFFRALAGDDWFRDDPIDIRHKDASMALEGVWIYEMAELSSVRVRDAESTKAFLSRRVESFRRPYERTVTRIPRQVVFVGTTNESAFLSDPTGARRYWPVPVVSMPDLHALHADREQLWAEAFEAYQSGAVWHLTTAEAAALVSHQAVFQHEDPWAPLIASHAATLKYVTVPEILTDCLDKPKDRQTKGDQLRIAGILQALGYARVRVRSDSGRAWAWERQP